MSYQKIFVALDRSSNSEAIFTKAIEMAKINGASLMLFHCLPVENLGMSDYTNLYGEELVNFSQAMQQKIEVEIKEIHQWLESHCQKATEQALPTEWNWKLGEPGRAIQELAKTWDADLIIMGRRGRNGLVEFFLGSVSSYVIHHAHCCVLVIQ